MRKCNFDFCKFNAYNLSYKKSEIGQKNPKHLAHQHSYSSNHTRVGENEYDTGGAHMARSQYRKKGVAIVAIATSYLRNANSIKLGC